MLEHDTHRTRPNLSVRRELVSCLRYGEFEADRSNQWRPHMTDMEMKALKAVVLGLRNLEEARVIIECCSRRGHVCLIGVCGVSISTTPTVR